jgi:hypothetical protein
MPLAILLPMVVIGIAGIGVILHLAGLSRKAALACDAAAMAVWDDAIDTDPACAATLSRDRDAALITTAAGRQGVVFAMGADWAARPLDGAQIDRTGDLLTIRLADFTAPRIRFSCAPGAELPPSLAMETTA